MEILRFGVMKSEFRKSKAEKKSEIQKRIHFGLERSEFAFRDRFLGNTIQFSRLSPAIARPAAIPPALACKSLVLRESLKSARATCRRSNCWKTRVGRPAARAKPGKMFPAPASVSPNRLPMARFQTKVRFRFPHAPACRLVSLMTSTRTK